MYTAKPQGAVQSELATLAIYDSTIPWQSGAWREHLILSNEKNPMAISTLHTSDMCLYLQGTGPLVTC